MNIVTSIAAIQTQSRRWRMDGKSVALVPTMGYLHAGHISLVTRARELADITVVSIFVNPTQFSPSEDLTAYPRDLEADRKKCLIAGVDAIFLPAAEDMYPTGFSTWVNVEHLSQPLCGASRPTHFRGVATVVAKLFLAVLPDVAVFGWKDAQQAIVIRRMVRDLNFPIAIDIAPTLREPDGLAMSSRNLYLTPDERYRATSINRGLTRCREYFDQGERSAATLIAIVTGEIAAEGGEIEYVSCVDTSDLNALDHLDRDAIVAVAARFGRARLIDNVVLTA